MPNAIGLAAGAVCCLTASDMLRRDARGLRRAGGWVVAAVGLCLGWAAFFVAFGGVR